MYLTIQKLRTKVFSWKEQALWSWIGYTARPIVPYPRASEELFIEFCEDFEYTPVIFRAFQKTDGELKPI